MDPYKRKGKRETEREWSPFVISRSHFILSIRFVLCYQGDFSFTFCISPREFNFPV